MEYGTSVDAGGAARVEALALVGKALANGRRLQLLEMLTQGERSVEAIAHASQTALSTTSAHLQILRRAGLVRTRRDGTTIFYRVAGPQIAALLVAVNRVARAHPSSPEPQLDGGESVPVIDAASVTADMLVLDVRPPLEYDAGHFPGAVSIPLPELADRWAELDPDRYVVVYCRSEWCGYAREAARFLRRQRFDVAAMSEGVVEWQAGRRVGLTTAAAAGEHC
ncbi:metalloregulator ArsR/SmtB family transcription factor [Mycolicibacillus parakoreensis]|uniref:Metalloregulator ArsR/SmtB family transcription factor n=1 Tax=Mycolicibacillus parakoreensis TaxID=1069221 RepID=A0ABY3TZZ7_9MYCO|nr:metalloregulator ArsR/SmtB family transcription factor [Mycolicibacillus parakoreensis]MCV7316565.1 metalloregulator ArsR/SmtB family transcription factor [Mycolicibacillus parakoreensis]ULN52787.1 metalloregulator ArsR/SmtB family transcription factor [Mycolicibacillus parakoreensis]